MKKNNYYKKIFIYGFVIILLFMSVKLSAFASENVDRKTVKVGFFSADGYHVKDENGTMSGYGFDFLQMMLRYNDWKYEYIGYDKNWGDMLDMLDRGEIDLVTLANETPEREEKYAFSEKPIGTSSTIMSISSNNKHIIPGDYSTYQNAVVGLVDGSSHNAKFEEYAKEKGFTYTAKYYEDIADLLADLHAEKEIDIAVTSNMRVLDSEIILDEFNSSKYYVMVRKDNTELLDQINSGLSQLNINSPDWQTKLFEKYYDNIHSQVIGLSVEEREYLDTLKKDQIVIKAAMNPELKPYSYFENGEAKGIAPTLFAEIANRLGIRYEILKSNNRWEYKEQLTSKKADIDLTAFLDYSMAQEYNLKETDAYIDSTLALLTRKDVQMAAKGMIIAVLKEPTEYIGFNKLILSKYEYKEYDSVQECIDAVLKGEVDGTFRYAYIAQQAVANDYTRKLQYSVLPDYAFSLSIGVNNEEDHRLLSVLNKGVNSLTANFKQGVIIEQTSDEERQTSLVSIIYDYPEFIIICLIFLFSIICIVIYLTLRNNAQKEKLRSSHETQRFMTYICESYETVAEINLQNNKRITYTLKNGKFQETVTDYKRLDQEYLKPLVKEEDLERMEGYFSDEKLDKLIQEGGEEYFEIQIRDRHPEDHDTLLDTFSWYSYIIRGVPKDAWHPRSVILFEKNIQESKKGEEEQKQLLRDALNTAKSASAAKGQFLSRMSHEIRTPLNAVIGYMEIAKDAVNNPTKMLHCIENSDMAAKHLLNIINDVLDISSIESGRLKIAHEKFNLKKQLCNISTIFYHQAKDRGVQFETYLNNFKEEYVIGDTLRLNQILMNLLSNAVKFTPEQGHVTLTVTQVNAGNKAVFLKFVVSDDGIGMSDAYKKKLFQPFEQESATTAQKYGGTGLGLSITSNLINLMGGSIEVDTKQNVGTTFAVSLHFDKCMKKFEEQQDYSKVRALIVDDKKESSDYLKGLLKYFHIKSDIVIDRTTAVKRIIGRIGTEYTYSLCFVNCNLKKEDCVTLVKTIQNECQENTPEFVAMAYDMTEYEEQMKSVGVENMMSKPVFVSSMSELLTSLYGNVTSVKKEKEEQWDITGLRVLLAEDNPMNLEIAMEILQKAGLIVDPVTDGRQAYDRFVSQEQGTYDAILMDVQMPIMDGYQATGEIRKSNHPEAKTIPIIAMTANAFAEDVNTALASGMNGHISKPVNYDKLYEVLYKFCK